jgi:hypothetical protein
LIFTNDCDRLVNSIVGLAVVRIAVTIQFYKMGCSQHRT